MKVSEREIYEDLENGYEVLVGLRGSSRFYVQDSHGDFSLKEKNNISTDPKYNYEKPISEEVAKELIKRHYGF